MASPAGTGSQSLGRGVGTSTSQTKNANNEPAGPVSMQQARKSLFFHSFFKKGFLKKKDRIALAERREGERDDYPLFHLGSKQLISLGLWPFAGWSEVWKDGIRQRKESARPELRPTKTVIT